MRTRTFNVAQSGRQATDNSSVTPLVLRLSVRGRNLSHGGTQFSGRQRSAGFAQGRLAMPKNAALLALSTLVQVGLAEDVPAGKKPPDAAVASEKSAIAETSATKDLDSSCRPVSRP